ncbi:MAG: hypothetical protein ACJAV0_000428 [Shewanella sp.]|jgi:hypothetical protein
MKTLTAASNLTVKALKEGILLIPCKISVRGVGFCNFRVIQKTIKGYRVGLKMIDGGKVIEITSYDNITALKRAISH